MPVAHPQILIEDDNRARLQELEQARLELARAALRLEQILKSVSDGVYGVDGSGRITFVNAALECMSGRCRSELIGQLADEALYQRKVCECVGGTNPPPDGVTVPAATDSGGSKTVCTAKMWRLDGTTLPVELITALLKDGDSSGVAVVMIRDVTEQTRYEKALELASTAAGEASRAKSAFLAIMSHELRTPLNTILGFSEIIRDEAFGPGETARYREYAADIAVAGTHLLDLINDILDLSKIEAGRMEIDPGWLDLSHAINGVTRLVREKAQNNAIGMSIDLAKDVPPLWADARAFKQIVINLLSNALKYTPRGGRITIQARCGPNGGITISVNDNGPGIPPDKLSRLFKPFVQVDNRYNRSSTGTGLGLSLIKGLVEIHGGTVSIASTIGVGTTVSFLLPAGPGCGPVPPR